jgi:hypothetical protein
MSYVLCLTELKKSDLYKNRMVYILIIRNLVCVDINIISHTF